MAFDFSRVFTVALLLLFLLRYHNRATLVVSALQVEKHPYVSEVASQLELKMSVRDGDDADTIASIGDAKSLGVHSPYKALRFGFWNFK